MAPISPCAFTTPETRMRKTRENLTTESFIFAVRYRFPAIQEIGFCDQDWIAVWIRKKKEIGGFWRRIWEIMTTQKIVIRQYTVDRPQPLLEVQYSSNNRLAEVAGGTTAECAAVCCCCPFALVNLLVLAVYGVPAGLCRKALRKKRRRRLLKKGLLVQGGDVDDDLSSHRGSSCDGAELLIHEAISYDVAELLINTPAARYMMKPMEADSDVIELENEMWDKFYGTGFWRSASQRVD